MIFTPTDIQTRLRGSPFAPLRIVTTTGQTYDIRHPELAMVAQHFLFVGLPSSNDPTIADQITRIALVHITELQDLPSGASPFNGSST
jgi:hypothetical protein